MSEVTICNLALAHLGDTATIASIKPPDSSVQAQLCAQFYLIARDALLEMRSWTMATRRIPLARVDNPSSTWLYAYAMPANVIDMLAVIANDAPDDYQVNVGCAGISPYPGGIQAGPLTGGYTPQPYSVETDDKGNQIILTNQENAVLRCTVIVTDTTQFGPLFTLTLSWLLASMLAGPIIKGEQGEAVGERCLSMFKAFLAKATEADADHGKTNVKPSPIWMRGR